MSDETRRFAVGISLIAALVIGLFFWSRSKPGSTAPLQPAEAAQEVAQVARTLPRPRVEPPPVAAPKAIEPIAQTRAQPEPAQIDTNPARLEFPADLPASYTPAHFHDALVEVIAECKLPYQLEEEDCSEFPCIVWGRWDLKVSKHIEVTECPQWNEKFGGVGVSVYMGGEEGDHHVGIVPIPPGPRLSDEASHRINQRANGMLESVDHRRIGINYGGGRQVRKSGPNKLDSQQLAKK